MNSCYVRLQVSFILIYQMKYIKLLIIFIRGLIFYKMCILFRFILGSKMDEIALSIQTYKSQLEQVKLALQSAQDDETKEELTQLSSDLEELISVTEENLLEIKRKELLAQFPDSEDDDEVVEESSKAPSKDEIPQTQDDCKLLKRIRGSFIRTETSLTLKILGKHQIVL
jgi:hypothetical protein